MIALWWAVAQASPAPALVEAATSNWECELSPAQMQGVVDGAVDLAAKQFPLIVRGFARGKLANSGFFCHDIEIDASASEWASACAESERAFSRSWADEPQPFTAKDGKQVNTLLAHDADSVRLEFRGDNGSRITKYSFAGDKMTVEISIQADQLSKPMSWAFVYRKK